MVDANARMDVLRLDGQPISVGGVISRTFSVVGRHWLPFYGVALAFAALNSLQFLKASVPKGGALTAFNVALTAMQLIAGTIAQAGLNGETVRALAGEQLSLREALRVGLRRFFPYLGAAILFLLAISLSAILLLIPGIIVFCVYSQSLVVSIVERLGPIGSQSRSRELTRGNRWRVLGVYLVFYTPWLLFFFGIGAYAAIAAQGSAAVLTSKLQSVQLVTVIATFAVSPLFYAMPAVLYHHLRRAEGSGGLGNLSEVFA